MLLNDGDWKNSHDFWSKISFLSPLSFLTLNDKHSNVETMVKPFTKERRNSLEFSEIFALLLMRFYMFYHG